MLDLGFPIAHPERSHGYTALHNAAWSGSADLVDLLIARGARPTSSTPRFTRRRSASRCTTAWWRSDIRKGSSAALRSRSSRLAARGTGWTIRLVMCGSMMCSWSICRTASTARRSLATMSSSSGCLVKSRPRIILRWRSEGRPKEGT
ncbi:MAG: hypothetical protein ACRD2A_12430 [Vicinamibacterales bacterium]